MNARIIRDITNFIFVQDALHPADILFIPGGPDPEPGEVAAELYRQGFAPLVLPSGKFSITLGRFAGVQSKKEIYDQDYRTEWEFLSDVLQKNGVPERAILREDESIYTQQNALFSKKVLDDAGIAIRTAILCVKTFHARRALMYYQFAFPDVEFLVRLVPYAEDGIPLTADNWHTFPGGIRRVLGEVRRCGEQFEETFLREFT